MTDSQTDERTVASSDRPTILLSIRQVAERTGLSDKHLYRLARRGDLPARKVGRRTVVREVDCERFISNLPPAGPTGR